MIISQFISDEKSLPTRFIETKKKIIIIIISTNHTSTICESPYIAQHEKLHQKGAFILYCGADGKSVCFVAFSPFAAFFFLCSTTACLYNQLLHVPS